jgi:hypothetical protein
VRFAAFRILAVTVLPPSVVSKAWFKPSRRLRQSEFTAIIRGVDRRGAVYGCPLNNLAMELSFSNPQFRDALRAIFLEWQAALAQRIADTRGGARLDKQDHAAAAAFIVATYSGAMNLAKATQSSAPLRVAAQTLSAWMKDRGFVD